jgi:hypothetical protein
MATNFSFGKKIGGGFRIVQIRLADNDLGNLRYLANQAQVEPEMLVTALIRAEYGLYVKAMQERLLAGPAEVQE